MSDKTYQDLGLGDEVPDMTMSELTVEAQAQEAFSRLSGKVPQELSERFIQLGMNACKEIAARRPGGLVGVDELVVEFEGILRNLIDAQTRNL
jgi:hypothetical protein